MGIAERDSGRVNKIPLFTREVMSAMKICWTMFHAESPSTSKIVPACSVSVEELEGGRGTYKEGIDVATRCIHGISDSHGKRTTRKTLRSTKMLHRLAHIRNCLPESLLRLLASLKADTKQFSLSRRQLIQLLGESGP